MAIDISGIQLGINHGLPYEFSPGEFVTLTWKVTSNVPGVAFRVNVFDPLGLPIQSADLDLTGQVSPYIGAWQWALPPGAPGGHWHIEGEFYTDPLKLQYDVQAAFAFGVKEGALFVGPALKVAKLIQYMNFALPPKN